MFTPPGGTIHRGSVDAGRHVGELDLNLRRPHADKYQASSRAKAENALIPSSKPEKRQATLSADTKYASTSRPMAISLDSFPDEIIQHVLEFLQPEDTLWRVRQLSRRLRRVASEPTLWRHYCQTSFRYWNPSHMFREKFLSRDPRVNWMALFLKRRRTNDKVARLLNGVIASRVRRYQKFAQICCLGYDVKDYLLEQTRVSDDVEDALSRRYFSNAMLDSIHRSVALREWSRAGIYDERPPAHKLVKNSPDKRLEKLLGGFDMFFIEQEEGDIDWISKQFDIIAKIFLRRHPGFEQRTMRQKALALNKWLRLYDYTGMPDISSYRGLHNCLIGHALLDLGHSSLPAISTAIFVSIAQRLGIPAAPCAFPSHVHAVVSRTDSEGLNGPTAFPLEKDLDFMMYLDPYGSNHEVSKEDLRLRLIERGCNGANAIAYLQPASDYEIALRVAQNIRVSCNSAISWTRNHETNPVQPNPFLELVYGGNAPRRNTVAIREMAMYATLWSAALMVQPEVREDWARLTLGLLSIVMRDYPEDIWLVQKYLAPLFDRHKERFPLHRVDGFLDVWMWCNHLMRTDRMPAIVTRRDEMTWKRVKFKIGHVVRHKRYGFVGIVIAWSYGSTTNDERLFDWGGTEFEASFEGCHVQTAYYSCMREGSPKFLVRQQNIERVHDPEMVTPTLMEQAGRYFRKFNKQNCAFMSNIREMYPDD